MSTKAPTDFIYGVDERTIREVLLMDTFDFYEICDVNHRQLENSICGCVRNYLDEFQFVAPIVPYGMLIRDKPSELTPGLFNTDLRPYGAGRPSFEVGIYKQKKGDKEILSVGISSDVFNYDIISYYSSEGDALVEELPKIDMLSSVAYSGTREMDGLVNLGDVKVSELAHNTRILGFMRDGVKKPDYVGAAHLCVPYMVMLNNETLVSFNDDNYEFMGWLSSEELSILINAKEIFDQCYPDKNINSLYFAPDGFNEKLHPLIQFDIENWTKRLFADQSLDNIVLETIDNYNRLLGQKDL